MSINQAPDQHNGKQAIASHVLSKAAAFLQFTLTIELVVVVMLTFITASSATESYFTLLASNRFISGSPMQLCLLTSTVIQAISFSLYQLQYTIKGQSLFTHTAFARTVSLNAQRQSKCLVRAQIRKDSLKIIKTSKELINCQSGRLKAIDLHTKFLWT